MGTVGRHSHSRTLAGVGAAARSPCDTILLCSDHVMEIQRMRTGQQLAGGREAIINKTEYLKTKYYIVGLDKK